MQISSVTISGQLSTVLWPLLHTYLFCSLTLSLSLFLFSLSLSLLYLLFLPLFIDIPTATLSRPMHPYLSAVSFNIPRWPLYATRYPRCRTSWGLSRRNSQHSRLGRILDHQARICSFNIPPIARAIMSINIFYYVLPSLQPPHCDSLLYMILTLSTSVHIVICYLIYAIHAYEEHTVTIRAVHSGVQVPTITVTVTAT